MRIVGDVCVAVALAVALGATFVFEPRTSAPPVVDNAPPAPAPPPPPPPPPALPTLPPADPTPRVRVQTNPDGRFGLMTVSGNPDDPSDDNKKLTFHDLGETNNTRVMVDGQTPPFGSSAGSTVQPIITNPDGSRVMVWEYRGVRVSQTLRLVANDLSRRTDSLRVTYKLENVGQNTRDAGLRVMLDTLIGDNDGVPFLVPGRDGIVTSPLYLDGPRVPDFIQALERGDLDRPGVVIDVGLRPGEGEERPGILTLAHWPGSDAEWEYSTSTPFSNDTAVGLFYPAKPLAPGASRSMSFTYGLGTLSSTASRNASLSLTTSGATRSGASFWLMALVKNPSQGQAVNLTLPAGLTPRKPASTRQTLTAGGGYTQLSWLIDVSPATLGQVEVSATLEPAGVSEKQKLNVQPPDVQLTLLPREPYRAGRPFWVSALVRNPRAGQTVTLGLPDGLTLAEGHPAAQSVKVEDPAKGAGGYVQLNWLVSPGTRTEGKRTLTAKLAPDGAEIRVEINVSPASLTN